MEEERYVTGELVKVGDKVSIARRFRRPLIGVVAFVHDPSKPSPRNGPNEKGYAVELEDESQISCSGGEIGIILISRGD